MTEKSKRSKLSASVSSLYDGESVYYVYQHRCPETLQTVYTGTGCDSRCYSIFRPEARRTLEHAAWGVEMANRGYLPHQLVVFRAFGVSKKSALRIEKDILRKCKETGMDKHMFNRWYPKN